MRIVNSSTWSEICIPAGENWTKVIKLLADIWKHESHRVGMFFMTRRLCWTLKDNYKGNTS